MFRAYSCGKTHFFKFLAFVVLFLALAAQFSHMDTVCKNLATVDFHGKSGLSWPSCLPWVTTKDVDQIPLLHILDTNSIKSLTLPTIVVIISQFCSGEGGLNVNPELELMLGLSNICVGCPACC